jgi:hypothetical protein
MIIAIVRQCRRADGEHRQNPRQYAHTFHRPGTICIATAFWELPKKHRRAVLLHELGHLAIGPDGSEQAANKAIQELTGQEIMYADSPYGEALEIIK